MKKNLNLKNFKTKLLTQGSVITWKGDCGYESGIFSHKIGDTGYCKIELTSGLFRGTKTMVPITDVFLQHTKQKAMKEAPVMTT
jgi:hypothetical protein